MNFIYMAFLHTNLKRIRKAVLTEWVIRLICLYSGSAKSCTIWLYTWMYE
jgi:hypothetical protein